MSSNPMPVWKVLVLQRQQHKKEEEKRRDREEEVRRRAKLPAWKRHAELPKTVIIIDKNKVANEVNLLASSSALGVSELFENEAEDLGRFGRDEPDSGAPSGVSEEHCTSVQNNPFLKLEKKKRRAPPPPKGGPTINLIA